MICILIDKENMLLQGFAKENATVLALGNEMRGDDGIGIYAGKILSEKGYNVILCHSNPEAFLDKIRTENVLIIDAAVYDSDSDYVITDEPGSANFASTHNFPVKLIFDFLKAKGKKVLLAGIKAEDTNLGKRISGQAKKRAESLIEKIREEIR